MCKKGEECNCALLPGGARDGWGIEGEGGLEGKHDQTAWGKERERERERGTAGSLRDREKCPSHEGEKPTPICRVQGAHDRLVVGEKIAGNDMRGERHGFRNAPRGKLAGVGVGRMRRRCRKERDDGVHIENKASRARQGGVQVFSKRRARPLLPAEKEGPRKSKRKNAFVPESRDVKKASARFLGKASASSEKKSRESKQGHIDRERGKRKQGTPGGTGEEESAQTHRPEKTE